MTGLKVQPSWDVRYIASITSVEYGLGAAALYSMCREHLRDKGLLTAVLVYAMLLATLHGAFIRQPLMDYIVGNPLHVVLVQNSFQWLVWLLMSIVVVLGIETINKFFRATQV